MNKKDYINIGKSIIKEMEGMEHKAITVGDLQIESDISDIGNLIGIAIGEHIVKHNLIKEEFIHGIKHGISLKDGTHNK